MMARSTKAGGKEEEGGDVQSDGVCLPKKPLRVMGPAFLGAAECLPANGKQQMDSLVCFYLNP